MPRVALALAFVAVVAAGLPGWCVYVAVGAGIAAVGVGWVACRDRSAGGGARLAGAAAVTVGGLGLAFGAVRIALVLWAIARLGRLV